MSDYRELHVRVEAVTPFEDLEADDNAAPGTYLVYVAKGLSLGTAASCALDVFHEKNGIECLDDFVISVMDPRTHQILDESEDHESYSATPKEAKYGDKIMNVLEGTEFSVSITAVNIDNPRDRAALGDVRLVAENIGQVRQRAFDLLWDSRLDSANCRPEYKITHGGKPVSLKPGQLFWWSSVDGAHRAISDEHEYLVFKAADGDTTVVKAYIDDRHEASRKSIKKAKAFCQDVESGNLTKKPIVRP